MILTGHTDGGRNPFYEGFFEGETEADRDKRLALANAFPKPTYNERDGLPCGECRLQIGERCDICGVKYVV